jgi:hypothetical protein
MITESVIRCPNCGCESTECMPADACQFFYDCKGCGARLKPKDGEHVTGLRETAQPHLLGIGVHPKVASERLGHSRIGITPTKGYCRAEYPWLRRSC